MAGFCKIWVPNFGLVAKPLCEGQIESLCQKAFQTIKEKLLTAPALALPDLRKLLDLLVQESQAIGLGVLTQNLENITRPVTYFSKQLDTVFQ